MFKSFGSLMLSAGVAIVGLQSFTAPANAQTVAQSAIGKAYFTWDWGLSPQGSSTYLAICSNPEYNYNRRTGGCARIDVFQENVSARDGLSIEDRLVVGQRYRACIAVDAHPAIGRDRYVSCEVFPMDWIYSLAFGARSLRRGPL